VIFRRLAIFGFIAIFIGCAHTSHQTDFHCEGESLEFKLDEIRISGQSESYIRHSGDQRFANYIGVNLKFAPYQKLFNELQNKFGPLKNRGDAHVTVITPVEYEDVLKSHLSISEIHDLAEKFKLQEASFKAICLARSIADLKDHPQESTYYVVLEAPDLVQFRRRVFEAFVAKGGSSKTFDPEHFYPHITIGFSLRDLHESDGVKKDKSSCVAKLTLQDEFGTGERNR